MNTENKDLKLRTTEFALRIIKMYCALPKTTVAQVFESKCFVPAHRLALITGRQIGLDPKTNLFPKWAIA